VLDTLYAQFGAIIIVLVCGFAVWQGDEPERVGASAYFIAWAAALLVQDDANLQSVQWPIIAIDSLVLCVFAALTWKARRPWAIWAAALQLIGVCAHIATIFDMNVRMVAYYTALAIVGYGVLISLTVAPVCAWQERRVRNMP
jgi:phage shock protein PspC (stress-responsive transcriptional regulator)